MNKYDSSLKQVCLQCKTKPVNCNKNKCVRYNNIKELISNNDKYLQLVEWLKTENLTKKVENKLKELDLI